MKRVFITTFQNADNYGAMLQCFALKRFLDTKKYEAHVVNYDNNAISTQYDVFRKADINPLKTIYHLIVDTLNYKSSKIRKRNFENFRENFSLTKKINKINDLDLSDDDILITGSDQVWNPKITLWLDDVYFLNTNNNAIRKIAYAASCGSPDVLTGYSDSFAKKIKSFDAISVREKSLADFIQSKHGVDVFTALDPTLLLKREEWMSAIKDDRMIKEKYIFAYSVGNGNDLFYKTVERISKDTGYKIIFFDKDQIIKKYKKHSESWYKAGPAEFLNLLYYSELIVTTSFHGFALSSVLNKDIIVTLSTYPDRLLTLAEKIGLKGRIVKNEEEALSLLNKDIDWDIINNALRKARTGSEKWLINSIERRRK